MKLHKILLLLIIVMPSILMVSCVPTTPTPTIPIVVTIPSFKENYPLLLEEAKKWDADAYLHLAEINFNSTMSTAINAVFYSPTQNNSSYSISLMWDGETIFEEFPREHPVYHHKPIIMDDWQIDSQEILDYVLDIDLRRRINSSSSNCSFFRLERFLPLDEQPLVWSLSIRDCSLNLSGYSDWIYLDPNTGDILNLSRDIKPTRFPTKTPGN